MAFSFCDGMASTSLDELHLFHRIERVVFIRLVTTLMLDPAQSMLIMAIWLWLEDRLYPNIIKKMTVMPRFAVNLLAKEAISCLNCLESNRAPAAAGGDMPHTTELMGRNICLQMFHRNRFAAITGIKRILNTVCAKIFTDILPLMLGIEVMPNQRIPVPGFPHAVFGDVVIVRKEKSFDVPTGELWGWGPENHVSEDDRTMFLTFSRGFPVTEDEVRDLFARLFGNCVHAVHMQENVPSDEQPLFARLVLKSVTSIDRILNGRRVAKFRVNGKHIWARKYECRE